MLQVLRDIKHFNVKYYDELHRNVTIDHCVRKIGLLKILKISEQILNAMVAVRTLCTRLQNSVCVPCSRRERAVNMLRSVESSWTIKDAVGTSGGRCRDAVRTLCTRYTVNGKFDILGEFCGNHTAR